MSESVILSYEVLIREHHLDSFGHVNNATYLALYEEARWEVITQRGYGHKTAMKEQKGPVILEAQIKFIKEIKLRDLITITTQTQNYDHKVGVTQQKMLHADGSIASTGVFKWCFFDMKTRKLIPPTDDWLYAIGVETKA